MQEHWSGLPFPMDIEFSLDSSFLSALYTLSHCLLVSKVSGGNREIIVFRVPCMWWVTLLTAFKILCIYFDRVCFSVWVFWGLHLEFIKLVGFIDSCISSSLEFLAIIFSNNFLFLFLSSLLGLTLCIHCSSWWYPKSLLVCSLFLILVTLWFTD